jgi:hypothetical protein
VQDFPVFLASTGFEKFIEENETNVAVRKNRMKKNFSEFNLANLLEQILFTNSKINLNELGLYCKERGTQEMSRCKLDNAALTTARSLPCI